MDTSLDGKAGIVTGASRGTGACIARELAGEGAALVLAARTAEGLERCANDITEAGGRATPVTVDLRQAQSADALIEAALASYGRLDFIVCNATANAVGDFFSLSDQDWLDALSLKFLGHLRLVRTAWPHLRKSGGSVVVIGGISAHTPTRDSVLTTAVNAALLGLTKWLANRGIQDGIQVNAINPGPLRTERFGRRLEKLAAERGSTVEEVERQVIAEDGIRRVGEPDDIAGLVNFILSRRGSLLQGAMIDMDGGKAKTL